MQKQILLDLDEKIINEATAIFNYIGLDIQTGIKMFLTRVTKDKTISFLFSQVNNTSNEPNNRMISESEDVPIGNYDLKMTKNVAIRLFLNNGNKIARNVTFASKNRSAYNYWANPNFDLLNGDWSLILNDNNRHKLFLFYIPAFAISKSQLTPRTDIPNLIDLQIMYNDKTFTDNRSGFSFSKFFVEEIQY